MSEFRCVRCHADVDFERRGEELACPACGTTYPVVDGAIPVFLDDPSAAANYYGPMFREGAAAYDEKFGVESDHGRWVLGRLAETVPEMRAVSGGTFLEIGAGTGPLTRALEAGSPFGWRRLYVSDLSPEMLRVNRRGASGEVAGEIRHLACNVLATPFPDASVDLVIGMDILHHNLNYERALAEIRRILRPGGVCVLKEPHRDAYRFLAFFAGHLLDASPRWRPWAGLSARDRALVAGWRTHALRVMELADRGEHDALARLDDKYFFDPKRLEEEARRAGFARFGESNILFRPGLDVPVGPMFLDHFKGLGVSPRGLRAIAAAGAEVDATIGPFLLEHAPINTLFLFWA